MSGLSRRDLLKASAGAAAIAVPMSALSGRGLAGASAPAGDAASGAAGATLDAVDADGVELDLEGPVMFCVHGVRSGEVSILHGTEEVVVRDRQLVNRIVRAAQIRRAV